MCRLPNNRKYNNKKIVVDNDGNKNQVNFPSMKVREYSLQSIVVMIILTYDFYEQQQQQKNGIYQLLVVRYSQIQSILKIFFIIFFLGET